ncbi:MAG: glycosyltransferase [Chloroflexi bacterium]|nr:glycosyltransferase [Chloroflexota bacterium]
MVDLSIVLISRNQEWNIARLIESVLAATARVASKEIVLVDSASSDKTIEIAQHYPISILRLRPGQRLTSHAGRYVGTRFTSGDYVLFLDGDMALCPGWLERALAVMRDQPDVAAITGHWYDYPRADGTAGSPNPAQLKLADRDTDVSRVGGAAMYRRSVLEQVGTFNPYFYSDGEPELCVRIRHAGYRILRLGSPIAFHYSDPVEAISTLIARWKRNLWLGMGQSMRYHLGTPLFIPYVRERGYGCVPIVVLVVGLLSFLWALAMREWLWLGLWASGLCVIVIGDALRKRSLYRALYSLVNRLLVVDGTLRGFLIPPGNPATYRGKFDVIQQVRLTRDAVEGDR